MTSCNRCGERVTDAAAKDAKAVLKFCMTNNLTAKDLEWIVDEDRYKEIMDCYRMKLNDAQRQLIIAIVEELKKPQGKSAEPGDNTPA